VHDGTVVDLEAIAAELSAARETCSYIEPPSMRGADFSIDDGYRVGSLLHAEALRRGRTQLGVKLGFTNQAVWKTVGLDRPFWSPIYVETVTDRRRLSLDAFVEPRIEPEIVIGLGSELAHGAGRDAVAAAIAWAAVGFEIVHCHYSKWEMSPADAIADAGLHGLLVVGERHVLLSSRAEALAGVEVELRREEETVATGVGANALGGPVDAVTWLLRLRGIEAVPAGSVITTGTLTTAFPVAAGETWAVSTSGPLSLNDLRISLVG
jgi:2-keto-4-pentenoate hydratase